MICELCWQDTIEAKDKRTGKDIRLYSRLEDGGKYDIKMLANGTYVATYDPSRKGFGFAPHDLRCTAQQLVLENHAV